MNIKEMMADLTGDHSEVESNAQGFGTFKGVYIPSTLTILGVIMYLRMGWVVGNVGLIQTLLIVTISTLITLTTSLSISATATNMKVGGGGAYYMISRSLGVEGGAAIGIPLFLSQALGISFYIVGFSDSIADQLPFISPLLLRIGTLAILTALAYVSADLALKIQVWVFVAILFSIFSFMFGSAEPNLAANAEKAVDPNSLVGFWAVFAVFFPAVTGILTGVSMSGDLKNPSYSIPWGTLAAVITGYVVYMTIPILLYSKVSQISLISDNLIMTKISLIKPAIYLGIWGATLSSALGSLLGAPRILQALSKDKVVPSFIGKSNGDSDNPKAATIVTFLVALSGILLGDLNIIAPVLSMFFLTSYGVLNLSAAFEELISNPSWRPKFNVPWYVSACGAFACFAAMFMIDPGATFIALFSTAAIYFFMRKRKIRRHWDDMTRGIYLWLARTSITALERIAPNPKSWRPILFVFSGAPTSRWYLIQLADDITHGKGFLTIGTVLKKTDENVVLANQMQKSITNYLQKKNVQGLSHVSVASDITEGLKALVQSYGIGSLVPNTFLLGVNKREENFENYAKLIRFIYLSKKNVVLMKEGRVIDKEKHRKRIDVWWGRERHNASLMLTIAYMLQTSPEWRNSKLMLKSIVRSESERDSAMKSLKSLVSEGRLDIKVEIIIEEKWETDLKKTIRKSSLDFDLVIMGMRPPEDETVEERHEYYKKTLEMTSGFPPTLFVMAAQELDFAAIFE